jgi:LuxR family transcriptional regulator
VSEDISRQSAHLSASSLSGTETPPAILGYVERITTLPDMQQVWDYHTDVMARFGFNRVLYGFTRFRTEHSLGDLQDMLVLTNHDPAYIQTFMQAGYYQHAPMTLWALRNVGACSWREAERLSRSGKSKSIAQRIWTFNRSHGLLGGYTISFPTASGRAKGAIGLTSVPALSFDRADEIWAEHGRVIAAMCNVLHLRLIGLPHPQTRRALTPRQREVLEWVGDGKTTADIASIMGLTPPTVEKHLRLARETLDVATTAQAVLKAAFLNQIYSLHGDLA